jgi:ribonucleotide reductase beta subunit family protein with ferritin-like domain
MPGLTLSNEFISRDEALHTEFAVMIYHKLQMKLSESLLREIIISACNVEKHFVMEILPERLAGINSKMMIQYVEFVADRLAVQLGISKIYGVTNPLDFMELISLESKSNFFERTVSAYALANKTVDADVFDLSATF